MTWRLTYRDEQDGEPITEFTVAEDLHVFTSEYLAAELAGHGLQLTGGDRAHGIQIITRRDNGEDRGR